ncbi:MAG: Npt1/Npt2 family nucleotide transporter [Parachlamydiales bacterium]|jgi:AAA family ATP:ADP antiporter
MNASLGKWRQRFWPIEGFELKKFFALFLLKFLISLNYSIVTNLKDAIIITADNSGAETITTVKGFVVLPFAILYTVVFAKLSNHFKRSTLFYGIIGFFMLFYFLYGFVVYPHLDFFSPSASADLLTAKIGSQYQHYVALYRYWMHALFFTQSEMWGSVVIFLLFWGFTNQILEMGEAKRFYALFSAGGNLATIAAGFLTMHFARSYNNYLQTLQGSLLVFIMIGFLIMALYFWISRRMLKTGSSKLAVLANLAEAKTKLSLKEGFLYVARSKYLLALAVMLICYSLTVNIVEVTWKAHLKLQYTSPGSYQAFISQVNTLVGVVALLIAFFLSSNIVRFLGWKKSALLCPLIIGFTSLSFLFLVLNYRHLPAGWLAFSPALAVVFYGAVQNISTKALKYALFDPTKEMAFIPLDQEAKVKGKAAIDVIGSRLGKSGSSYLQMFLLFLVGSGSILEATSLIIPIVAVVLTAWILALRSIGKKVEEKTGAAA